MSLWKKRLGRKESAAPASDSEPDTTPPAPESVGSPTYEKGGYSGAEPLFRRALEGLLRISAEAGHDHPNLHVLFGNYVGCLEQPGKSPHEVRRILQEMLEPYGVSLE